MTVRTRAKLVLIALAAGFSLCLAEFGLRIVGRPDTDGNIRIRDTRLKPYHVPAQRAEQILQQYSASNQSSMVYDAELGWSQRPSVSQHNQFGFISSQPEPSREPSPDTLRIAVFGGSYTQGSFETGWWRVLERELNAAGRRAEVLNFGVAGYGMDQAYLRWRRDGAPWHPQVVIFGWAPGNCYDNLNMVRMIKDPETGVPFTKPRFVLGAEPGKIDLINSPTPSPDQLPAILRNPASWPIVQRDYFFAPDDFRMAWWRHSRLLAFVEAKAGARDRRDRPDEFYALNGEAGKLALAIIQRFKSESEAAGSQFFVAHLPHDGDLRLHRQTQRFPYAELYAAIQKAASVIQPESEMISACAGKDPASFYHDGHYKEEFQSLVGHIIAQKLITDAKK